MITNPSGILDGMDVYGSDGEQIGVVSQVWPDAVEPGAAEETERGPTRLYGPIDPKDVVVVNPRSRARRPSAGPVEPSGGNVTPQVGSGTTHPMPHTGRGYFAVNTSETSGADRTLYIPFDAVDSRLPGDRVILTVPSTEADQRFATKPDFL